MSLVEPIEVTLAVTAVLERLGIDYVVGGLLATSLHGIPRATLDVDIVADLRMVTCKVSSRRWRGISSSMATWSRMPFGAEPPSTFCISRPCSRLTFSSSAPTICWSPKWRASSGCACSMIRSRKCSWPRPRTWFCRSCSGTGLGAKSPTGSGATFLGSSGRRRNGWT